MRIGLIARLWIGRVQHSSNQIRIVNKSTEKQNTTTTTTTTTITTNQQQQQQQQHHYPFQHSHHYPFQHQHHRQPQYPYQHQYQQQPQYPYQHQQRQPQQYQPPQLQYQSYPINEPHRPSSNHHHQPTTGFNRATQTPSSQPQTKHTLSRQRDEQKKLRRAGILPEHARPKRHNPYEVIISRAAQEKRAMREKQQQEQELEMVQKQKVKRDKKVVAIGSVMTVSQLANITHQKLSRLQSIMQTAGLTDTRPDRILTSDDSAYLALESGYEPIVNDSLAFDIYPDPPPSDRSRLPLRPPIVCIMGHVDHGKTTLLDSLRSSSVAAQEAGGITQHIGAFEVSLDDLVGLVGDRDREGDHQPQTITFLDTPGHAAFSAMRSRGVMTTDVAVIVVAADDGVKPQTMEVIQLVKQTDVGIVVAITKCDKPLVDIHRTKAKIYEAGIEIESLGGEIPCVEVSALNRKGLDVLAETILAVAEVRDLRAEVEGVRFEGRVIESDVSRERGNVATIVGLRGRLETGMDLVAGCSYGRVRQLISVSGQSLESIRPGQPVQVTGWKQLPEAGSLVLSADDEEDAKRAYENRIRRVETQEIDHEIEILNEKRAQARESFEQQKSELLGLDRRSRALHLRERERSGYERVLKTKELEQDQVAHELRIVIKADFSGTVEAVRSALGGLGNDTVSVRIVSSGVGDVNESDVRMAMASRSMIIGFNVTVDRSAMMMMGSNQIECKTESVIYRLVEEVTNRLIRMLPKKFEEKIVGEASIAEIFEINVKGKLHKKVAGCKVSNGEIRKKDLVRIVRGMDQVLWEGNLEQLKHGKKEEKLILKGRECGMAFGDGFDGFLVGDKVLCVEKFEVARSLNDRL